MYKIKKYLGVILIKTVIPRLNRLVLWAFGWKREIHVYRLRGFIISKIILWRDPKSGLHSDEETAIIKCKESDKNGH